MKRINTLSLLLAIIILGFLAFSYDLASAQQRRKILVAYVAPGITQTIPWVAKEAGIFTKHGIDARRHSFDRQSPVNSNASCWRRRLRARRSVIGFARAIPWSGSGYFGNHDQLFRPKSFAPS